MEQQVIRQELEKVIMPVLEQEQIELVELILSRIDRGLLLRLLVDKEEGIDLEECAKVNKKIGALLDSQDMIKNNYVLEVSSPGLDRPLKSRRDFSRCINIRVRFFLNELIEGKLEWAGEVKGVDEEAVVVGLEDKTIRIPLGSINKAKQVI